MTKEAVLKLMGNYKSNDARARFLPNAIKRLELERDRIMQHLAEDQVRITSIPDGMPRSGRMNDPTADVGGKLADGWVPDRVRDIDAEIECKRAELVRVQADRDLINNLLSGLDFRDTFILKRYYCDRMRLRDIRFDYQRQYGVALSLRSIQRYIERATEHLAELAK